MRSLAGECRFPYTGRGMSSLQDTVCELGIHPSVLEFDELGQRARRRVFPVCIRKFLDNSLRRKHLEPVHVSGLSGCG